MALIFHVFSGACSRFPMEKFQKKRARATSSKRAWLFSTCRHTHTRASLALGLSPEVVNAVSRSGFAFKALWAFHVVSLWSWMFRVLLKSKFSSFSLWQGLGEARSRSPRSGCGASWAKGWCRNCGWERARSLLPPPQRGTWKGSEGGKSEDEQEPVHRSKQYPKSEGILEDHRVQLLALHRHPNKFHPVPESIGQTPLEPRPFPGEAVQCLTTLWRKNPFLIIQATPDTAPAVPSGAVTAHKEQRSITLGF